MDSPDEYSPADLMNAYGLAAKAGDTEAMNDLHGRLLKAYQKQDAKPTDDMGVGSRLLAGVGHGMERLSEGTVNMLGLGGPVQRLSDAIKKVPLLRDTPLANANFTNEGLKAEDEAAKPLLDTGAGKVGDVAGQVAAMAPVGGATGGAVKAAGPLLAKAGTYAPQVFKAALAGLEGAGQGAAISDPEHQLEGAATGAIIGSGLSGAGSAAGKAVRGMVDKSPAAQRLIQDADEEGKKLFIPISQGGTGPAKAIYKTVLPYALGVEHQLKGQSAEAKKVVEEIAAEQGMPAQANSAGKVQKIPAPNGDTMEETAAGMRSEYGNAEQNTINNYSFKPQNFQQKVFDNLQDVGLPRAHRTQIAEHVGNLLNDFADEDGSISGQNLLRARAAAIQTLPGISSASGARIVSPETAKKAVSSFDQVVQDAIDENRALSTPKTSKNPAKKVVDTFNRNNPQPADVGFEGQQVGAGRAGVAPDPFEPHIVHLEALAGDPTGAVKGAGAAALRQITDLADKHGATIKLDAVPNAARGTTPPLNTNQLMDYYSKAGFKPDPNGQLPSSMIREPTRKLSKQQQAASETVRDLENFQRLMKTRPEGDAVVETSEANPAGRGALNFKQLAGNSPPGSQMRSLAQDAHQVLEKESPGGVNPAGRHFFHLAEIGTGLVHPGAVPAVVTGNLLGNALATKTAQNALYGDLAFQKTLAKVLKDNPQAAYSLGQAGRSAANASGQ